MTFAEADAAHRAGQFDRAFGLYAEADAARRNASAAQATAIKSGEALRDAIRAFTAKALRRPREGRSDLAPIFIVGMPRSGSTLIEQILDSHPNIQGLGEIPALPAATALFRPNSHGTETVSREVRLYLAGLLGWDGVRRPADKHLMNFRRVGLIHLMFPNATILHAVRDPLDTCFSNFRTNFTEHNATSFDLAEIGCEYVRYRQMMNHWSDALPGRVVEVPHEALAANPAMVIPQLLAACGLPFDPTCLSPHLNPRVPDTASKHQVRRPINTAGIGQWRPYKRHLGPLFEALGQYAHSFS